MGYLENKRTSGTENTQQSKLVRQQILEDKQYVRFTANENILIIIREGELDCTIESYPSKEVQRGYFFILPAGYSVSLSAKGVSRLMYIAISDRMQLHKSLSFNSLQEYLSPNKKNTNPVCLKTHPILKDYLNSLDIYMDHNMDSSYLFEAKITELFYLLDNLYLKEELALFFEPYLTDDYSFREQIRKNYRKARTVRELSGLLHYSYSGFNKRFKRVFNVSAYSWMQRQRAKMIYRELCSGEKPLKEISADYSFVSISHFNEFCHKELGAAPSKIRKSNAI